MSEGLKAERANGFGTEQTPNDDTESPWCDDSKPAPNGAYSGVFGAWSALEKSFELLCEVLGKHVLAGGAKFLDGPPPRPADGRRLRVGPGIRRRREPLDTDEEEDSS